jgi:hypothetical protein
LIQGEVQEVTPSYTIKKKKFRLSKNGIASFGGWRNCANTQLNTPAAKANLLFQNKKEM